MKNFKKTLSISLIVFGFALFFFHLIAFIKIGNGHFISKFVGYFTNDYSGSFLIFIGIIIFSGVYLLKREE